MEKNDVRVLVVDDEEEILKSLETHLELDGYDVSTASSAAQALNTVTTWRPHIVIADINMPQMDGIEMLEEIKKEHGHIVVIMITAYSSLMKVGTSRFHGAADYVMKPFRDLAELDEVVDMARRQVLRWDKVIDDTLKTKRKDP